MRNSILCSLIGVQIMVLLGACGRPDSVQEEKAVRLPGRAEAVRASFISPQGSVAGTAMLGEDPNGVTVEIVVSGLPAGAHGVHLHAIGQCGAPGFENAGPHWNPTERKHGRDNPEGAHLGDLANLQIEADGSGRSTFVIGGAHLRESPSALLDGDGAALVIHAKADDYQTDPSGESGDRIACAVLKS